MTAHEGSRLSLRLRRRDYDALLDYVARFRWDQDAFSFATLPRAFAAIVADLPLVQHEWF